MSNDSDPPSPVADKWAEAIKASRVAATTAAASLAAIGTAVFGGIPALKGLPFEWGSAADNPQTFVALIAAAVGLGGILLVIVMIVRVSLPVYSTLSGLSPATTAKLTPTSGLLPPGIDDVPTLQAALSDQDDAVLFLENQWVAAQPENKAAAQAALEAGVTQQQRLRSWADNIRQLDAFEQVQSRVRSPLLWGGVIAAAIGCLGFMFATAQQDEPEESTDSAVGDVAYLRPVDEAAWNEIAESASIEDCVDASGRYLVLVQDVADDVYTVQTLPRKPGCETWTFSVRLEVASITLLAQPRELTIKYTPSPAPTK